MTVSQAISSSHLGRLRQIALVCAWVMVKLKVQIVGHGVVDIPCLLCRHILRGLERLNVVPTCPRQGVKLFVGISISAFDEERRLLDVPGRHRLAYSLEAKVSSRICSV